MFSKKLAGIGAVTALVGSALVPSMAFAADDPPATGHILDGAVVAIEKAVVVNDQIDPTGDEFVFTASPVTADPTKDLTADPPALGESGFKSSEGIDLNLEALQALVAGDTSAPILPTDMSVFGGVPGIYEWIVAEDEANSTVDPAHTVVFDKRSYRVKAYVTVDPDYVAPGNDAHPYPLMYNGVTIVQLTDEFGEDADPVKVDALEFKNVYEDVPDNPGDDPDDPDDDVYGFTLTKHVVNPSGANELGSYTIEVEFGWPANFDGDTTSDGHQSWTGHTPDIDVVDSTQGSCTPDATAKKTECEVTLDAVTGTDVTAKFTGVPVGATYKVTETTPEDGFNATYSGGTSGNDKIPAGGAAVTVTNTYTDITPTGIMLAVLPYVLMIGIPLLAIAGYIVLRRKMNL